MLAPHRARRATQREGGSQRQLEGLRWGDKLMGFTSKTHCLTPSGIHVTGPQSQTLGKTKSWTQGPRLNVVFSWHTRAP